MMKKPCPSCPDQPGTRSIPKAFSHVINADRFTQATTPLIHDAGMQIAAGVLDPVIALLILRRRIGFVAEQLESCEVCRRDIQLGEEHDQMMINGKQTREEYRTGNRWRALVMFAKFEKNVLRACIKWVIGL